MGEGDELSLWLPCVSRTDIPVERRALSMIDQDELALGERFIPGFDLRAI